MGHHMFIELFNEYLLSTFMCVWCYTRHWDAPVSPTSVAPAIMELHREQSLPVRSRSWLWLLP